MIELFLKAIDRLIELVRIGEKRSKVRYEEIYKPSFADLQSVHADYLAMLHEFSEMLKQIPDGATKADNQAKAALDFLRVRRLTLSPVREKLWAFRSLVEKDPPDKLPQVERAFLWALVLYFESTEIIQSEHRTFASGLLDKLESALEPRAIADDRDEPHYSLPEVRRQCDYILDHINNRWRRAVEVFNRLRLDLASETS
jgi:hypothetical protein